MTTQLFQTPPATYRPSDHLSVRRVARPNATPPHVRLLLALTRRARRVAMLAAVVATLGLPASGASAEVLAGCPPSLCNPVPVPTPPMQQLIVNGGFESPYSTFPNTYQYTWLHSGVSDYSTAVAHCGKYSTSLPGSFGGGLSGVSQQVAVPTTTGHAFLDFWVYFPANESDFVSVDVGTTTVFSTWSTTATSGKWSHFGLFDVDLSAYRGQSVWLGLAGLSTAGRGPSIDDVSLTTDIHLLSSLC